MKNRERSYPVTMDMRMNQLRNILSSLTDDEKSSYLDSLKQIDKEAVENLINEQHVNPYSYAMLEQLEAHLKERASIADDQRLIEKQNVMEENDVHQRSNRQNEVLKEQEQEDMAMIRMGSL